MPYVVIGILSTTGTIHKLLPMKNSGKYQLTHPDLSADERKREKNYTLVDTIEEAVELINDGYYARMHNIENTDAPDIIANQYIKVFELP